MGDMFGQWVDQMADRSSQNQGCRPMRLRSLSIFYASYYPAKILSSILACRAEEGKIRTP